MAGYSRDKKRKKKIRWTRGLVITSLLLFWVFLVSVYFLWEASRYAGLSGYMAEWEFAKVRRSFPIFNFALLVGLFGSPALWLLRDRHKRYKKQADEQALAEVQTPELDTLSFKTALVVSKKFRRSLFIVSGGLLVAALAALLWAFMLPPVAPTTRTFIAGKAVSGELPSGPANVQGRLALAHMAAFSQKMFFLKREVRFAPVVSDSANGKSIRFFVELQPTDSYTGEHFTGSVNRSGVLMRNDMPGAILQLYRYVGYSIERPYYILYSSETTMRWPYYFITVQLLLASLLALIAALLQHRHIRSVEKKAQRIADARAEADLGS